MMPSTRLYSPPNISWLDIHMMSNRPTVVRRDERQLAWEHGLSPEAKARARRFDLLKRLGCPTGKAISLVWGSGR